MKRFVSYLYTIHNNQKIHNAGFARIELRTGRNRIDIHMRENGYSGKTGTVYLFVRNKENIQGISIGNILFRNNQADFRYEQAEENIGQTPWQIMQMNGILVFIDDCAVFLSQWDEEPVYTSKFVVWQPDDSNENKSGEPEKEEREGGIQNQDTAPKNREEEQNMNQSTAPAQDMNQQKIPVQEAGRNEAPVQNMNQKAAQPNQAPVRNMNRRAVPQQKMSENQVLVRNMNRKAVPSQKMGENQVPVQNMNRKAVPPQNKNENEVPVQNINENSVSEQTMNQNAVPADTVGADGVSGQGENTAVQTDTTVRENSAAQSPESEDEAEQMISEENLTQKISDIQTAELRPQPENQWMQTWRHMLRTYPVLNQFQDKNVLAVRIEIKDVRMLPEKYWSIVNNSFLLHGFFNYRYLVFGRIGQKWFIGIPGIYQNQEHAMASIFGFPDFLAREHKTDQGEQPGYWYRILEI